MPLEGSTPIADLVIAVACIFAALVTLALLQIIRVKSSENRLLRDEHRRLLVRATVAERALEDLLKKSQ